MSQNQSTSKSSKKWFVLPWIIFGLSMSVTFVLWHLTREDILKGARADFDFRVEEIKQHIVHRMRGYELVLRGGVGYINASNEVTREKWHKYVKNLKINLNYPGIQGIGFSAVVLPSDKDRHTLKIRSEGLLDYSIWPEGPRPFYTSIIYLEPLDWRNKRAIGYDMYSEPVRMKAMDRAVENDTPAISGKVKLVQETQRDVQAGFLMYVPAYKKGMPLSTVDERRSAILGYVYSPFRMKDLMKGIIGREVPDLNIEIFDGSEIFEDGLMYDSDSVSHFKENRNILFEKTSRLELNGHVWTMHFSSLPVFDASIDREKPVIVLTMGTTISLLFFAMAIFLASHRARLHAINEELNEEIAERKRAEEELRDAHEELEDRVVERTEELTEANNALQNEIFIRRQAEEALRDSEERFRSLVETTNDWVWEMNASGVYTYASPMVLSILGYSPEEVIGKKPCDYMELSEAERCRAVFSGFFASRRPFTFEKNNLRKDGSIAILEMSGAPSFGPGGEFLGYRGITRDVTVRKRIEKEREDMQVQLIQSQKMELMGRLAGGVAHDFNNIMSIIASLNSLAIREAPAVGALRDYLDQINAASERAANLTRQLLIFSRNQPTAPATVDINKTVDDMLVLLRKILGENITMDAALDPGLLAVRADKSNVEQLLMNLVVNSREAMPKGGCISISTVNTFLDEGGARARCLEIAGDYVCLAVRDTGTGMDEKTLKRVFEPFFSTKGPGKGIGLGLTVVHNIVKEYRGGISVESRPGEGACFSIYLPASQERPRQAAKKSVREPQGRGERILLVEDEIMLRKSVSLVLSKSGYKVFTARDAEEAAYIFERENSNFHLVFSDVVLKGRSGVNIVDDLLTVRPSLKVIFASGYMDIESQWPYIKERGFRFLQKPYEIPELLRAIRESLDGD